MHCHNPVCNIPIPEGARKIVLAGNPNVGKSVFFNALTGMYVDVSNFPGTTVDISVGRFQNDVVMDTPGVYGVSSFNDEERVARDVILYADVILNVVDAVHLERDLFLTQQLIDMGIPVVVALNMMDEVKRNGLRIDIIKLSQELGVEVIPTTAIKKEGFENIKKAFDRAKPGNAIPDIKALVSTVSHRVDINAEALLVVEEDENILERHQLKNEYGQREYIYKLRRNRIDQIVDKVVSQTNQGASFKTKLGRWMLQPLTAIPILFVALYLTYQLIGVFVAQTVVGITEEVIMGEYYYNFVMDLMTRFVDESSFLGELLIGEFGVLTMAPIYLFGLLLPLVAGFYFILSIMEDSGYLPRIAALVDRLLTNLGLNGRAIIPMILGFGCVTMATITTRLLGSKRERFIATMLLGLAIPCSAQLGVIIGLIAPLGGKMVLLYSITIFIVFVLTGTILNKLMPGESTDLLIDLPPLRVPLASNVLKKTYIKSKMFIAEAGPLFVVGAVIVTILQYTGALDRISDSFAPVTVGFLKLPKEVAQTFIMGIIRRDFGAAGLNDLASQGILNPLQVIVSLVAITLFVPCIAAIMVIFKERSWQESALIWVGSFVISFLTAGILAQLVM
ncbi:ferrous iron transport protein B [Geosporobacter ferrireducens]|uniref:Ferrous iron transport protein B n=1 Tax=Geosporobacter ferrireducens TaxID=1424294 RepID=A0A1D8GFQ4_9FIRM|nr:ferrous iron transport protein B [Geosporobacter ferrireducens]AOT69720.1 ferrous iron transport protein B [Geosporobacter ferrireducens]MTI54571.1 ferrous iron transport protein B [Geosporobacter ferrireducens]